MPQATTALVGGACSHPLLTPAQEIELGRRIRAWQDYPGGPDAAPPRMQRSGRRALDRFLVCNLRLAHHVARRYIDRGIPLEDLVQAAAEGMLTAYRRFDPSLGYRSSSYAVWYARQACQQAIANHATGVRLPTSISEALRRCAMANARLTRTLQRTPTPEEVEEAAGLRKGQLGQVKAAAAACDVRSLDAPIRRGHGSEGRSGGDQPRMIDAMASKDDPATRLDRLEMIRSIRDLVGNHDLLNPQQRFVLRSRYLQDPSCSHAYLSAKLNCSRTSVLRLERTALRALARLAPEMRHFLQDS